MATNDIGVRSVIGYALVQPPRALPKGLTGERAVAALIAAHAKTARPASHFTASNPTVLSNDPVFNTVVTAAPTAEAGLSGTKTFRYNRVHPNRIPIAADTFDLGGATSVTNLLPLLNTASGMTFTASDFEEAVIPTGASEFTLTVKSTSFYFLPGTTLKVGLFAEPILRVDPSNLAAGSTAIVDRAANPATLTNVGTSVADVGPKSGMKSVYFPNDKANYLRFPGSAKPNLLEGDFTIEFWFLPESRVGTSTLFSQWAQITGRGGFLVTHNPSGGKDFSWGAFNENAAVMSNPLAAGAPLAWEHMAFTRKGNVFTSWRNGVSVNTWTSATTRAATGVDWGIGAYNGRTLGTFPQDSAVKLNGWLADLKVYKYSKYNTPFTP